MAFSAARCASKQRSSYNASGTAAWARATARLLRARRSHSPGCVGSRRSAAVDHPSFSKRRPNDCANLVTETLDVVGRDNNDIDSGAYTDESHVNLFRQATAMFDAPL
jgi:hypothetical protein